MLSASKVVNQEALDSQIYNPTTEPSILMLQQIMETTPAPAPTATQISPPPPLVDINSVPDDLKEHLQNFLSLPTRNPFHGVVVNPALCHIDDIRNGYTDLNNYMNGTYGNNPDWTNYVPQYNQDCNDINNGLNGVQDHTDRLTSNLPSLAGLAQSALALSTIMNLLSNPCLGLDGLLGSIMDSGKQLLNDAAAKVKELIGKARAWVDANIGPLVDQIKNTIADAKAKVAAMIAKAQAEIMNFAKAMLAQVRQGLAELMANLPKDPCLRGLLQSAATGAAAAIIK